MSQETLNTLITVVVLPILAAIVPMVVTFLRMYTNKLKAQIADESFHKYVDLAEDAVATAVISVHQTFVSTLKANGGWNEQSKALAFEMAKKKALAIMGDNARTVLQEAYGDIDAWLDDKIETVVSTTK